MPVAWRQRAPAQPSVLSVAEPVPVTVVISVAITAVVATAPSEESHMMRSPEPVEPQPDIDERRPAPAIAHIGPSPVVIRRPSTRLLRDPRPAIQRIPSPVTVTIRRPARSDPARTPHPAVFRHLDPFAVIVQIVNARNRDRYVTRAVRRIHSGEQIVVAPVIPPIPIVFVFEARDAIERVTGFDDDPPALFDDDRPDLL